MRVLGQAAVWAECFENVGNNASSCGHYLAIADAVAHQIAVTLLDHVAQMGLRLVHRGLRHRRFERGEGVARRAEVSW